MKKKWVSQKHILHWFWHKTTIESLGGIKLAHDDELVEWCWQNDCTLEENYVICPDEETFLLFALKWS